MRDLRNEGGRKGGREWRRVGEMIRNLGRSARPVSV